MGVFDWLLKGASIIDGSGSAAYNADVGITGGKISAIAPDLGCGAVHVRSVDGLIVAPGFIDIHRHGDAAVFRPGFGEMELRQGITTIVNGNCGMSIAPIPYAMRDEILRCLSPVIGSLPENIAFESYSDYITLLKQTPLPLNVGMLAGSGTMRAAACGYHARQLNSQALHVLRDSLDDALSAGTLGISVGFSYMPDIYYTAEQLEQALAPIRNTGLPLVCHVRGEGGLLYDSVREAIQLAKLLRAPLEISHFKCIGRRNWGTLLGKTIDLIEHARLDGMEIHCDVYPWTAGSTLMTCLLPPAFLQGGVAETTERLRDSRQRALCREVMSRPGEDFENIVESMGWESIYVSGLKSERNLWCIGKSIPEIADARGVDPYEAAFGLMAEEGCDVTMVDYITCTDDIETILRLPYSIVTSDTVYPDKGRPHPRGYGNTAMLLTEYVQKRKTLTLEQAVHKMTGLPARIMSLPHKGLLRPGYNADIVVFGRDSITCNADYQNPERFTTGFELVMVGGAIAVERDARTNSCQGRCVLR